MDVNRLREYMRKWAEYTYRQGINFCRNNTSEEKEMCLEILKKQKMAEKKMDGHSIEGIPDRWEYSLREISLSGLFNDAIESDYLTPASYAVSIVKECIHCGFNFDKSKGVVGRGLRSFPAFLREMDLASKLTGTLEGCECRRANPDEDINGHTDVTIHDKGRTFKVIKNAFQQIGYTVYDKVLNSKDFGVPQNRERIYIVCFRNDIDSSKFKFPSGSGEKVCIRDILDPAPVPAKYYLSDVYMETLRKHRARHESKGNGFGYEIKDLDGIAGTIVCGGMGRERNLIIDSREHSMVPTTHIKGEINKEDIRKMTPREWARLQGFPEDFKLELADASLYKQFGNSVTVNVIEAIAREVKKVLK